MSAPGRTDWTEADWRLVAESIPHIVWAADAGGRTLYFNRRGVDYAGAAASELDWTGMVHPDELGRATTCWQEANRDRTPFEEDLRLRRADGTYLWHSCRSQPVLADDGVIDRWFGTATDIDDRKQVEALLATAEAESREVLQLLTELQAAAPVGIGFVDRDLRVLRMNAELGELARRPPEQQIGRTLADLLPDLWGQLEPICRHVLDAGGAVRNLPIARPPLDEPGAHREWVVNLFPVQIRDAIVGLGIVAVDVTERLQAEGFSSTVMSQVADGVYAQDPDGLLTYMNRAASRMLGWSEDELRGRRVHDVVHFQRADGTRVAAEDCALLREGADRRLERADEVFTRKDGSVFPVAYSSVPLQVGSRIDGMSVVFRDVSDPSSSTNLIRVLIADSDQASSAELIAMLTRHEGLDVVGIATDAEAAVREAVRLRPDVVLVDLLIPDVGGAATALRVTAEAPASSVILLALDYGDGVAAGAIAAGCSGIVDRRRAWVDLAGAVRAAYHGETSISQAELQKVVTTVRDSWRPGRAQDLTQREREVLYCLTQGLTNRQAATKLAVTVNTVRNHVQRILYKLDVHSRLEAVVLATRGGLLDDHPEA
jgi:PAS domain S-box-containing protein